MPDPIAPGMVIETVLLVKGNFKFDRGLYVGRKAEGKRHCRNRKVGIGGLLFRMAGIGTKPDIGHEIDGRPRIERPFKQHGKIKAIIPADKIWCPYTGIDFIKSAGIVIGNEIFKGHKVSYCELLLPHGSGFLLHNVYA